MNTPIRCNCGTIFNMGRPKKSETSVGVLAERQLSDGRRRIKLRKDERAALERSKTIEAACALFLDTSQSRTWAQIAEELSITPEKLRDITKSQEFEEKYHQLFAEIGHDPRYKAAQGALIDAVPMAVKELVGMITRPGIPPATKLRAIELMFKTTHLEIQPPSEQSDRQELAKFLVEHRVSVDSIPDEYKNAMRKYDIEGEFTEVKSPELPSGQEAPDSQSV